MEPGAGPTVLVLGGPNGAGKSTAAPTIIPESLPFLNADEIAKALPGYPSTAVDREAGRRLLAEMGAFEATRTSFAVETTLSGKTLASRISRLKAAGYTFRLIYIWTPSPDFSVGRVAERVRMGGHSIPEPTIRRRYYAGLRNLHSVYIPRADRWEVFENTTLQKYQLIAHGGTGRAPAVADAVKWQKLMEQSAHEQP